MLAIAILRTRHCWDACGCYGSRAMRLACVRIRLHSDQRYKASSPTGANSGGTSAIDCAAGTSSVSVGGLDRRAGGASWSRTRSPKWPRLLFLLPRRLGRCSCREIASRPDSDLSCSRDEDRRGGATRLGGDPSLGRRDLGSPLSDRGARDLSWESSLARVGARGFF